MYLERIIINNFKSLRNSELSLNQHLNVIVGDNETGKSTLLEAIHLVLTGKINNRFVQYELDPYLFNEECVQEYIAELKSGSPPPPPSILIEAYLERNESLSKYRGTNNSLGEDCPGIKLSIEFDEDYMESYAEYIKNPDDFTTLPIEYYSVKWFSFANNAITSHNKPLNSTFIDTSLLRGPSGAEKYVLKIISDVLDTKQRVDLSLIYRKMKEIFSSESGVKRINEYLATKKGDISEKNLSVSMDVSARSSWETSLTPHLDNIPYLQSGKGEQSTINMKLAMESSSDSHIFLVEEPENHLSYPNVNNLINRISERGNDKQILIATHSSFVLNKLGIENVILFNLGRSMTLESLSPDTRDYFMKLPGHDTLRLILSSSSILVEGPSDELIVQKAFKSKHGLLPLEAGIDVISVRSLAFKRFLDIAIPLKLNVKVITDNDGSVEKLKNKYKDYEGYDFIQIYYDEDETLLTLENQLLDKNSLELLNHMFETSFEDEEQLLEFMLENKTNCALDIFNTTETVEFPEYIDNAI